MFTGYTTYLVTPVTSATTQSRIGTRQKCGEADSRVDTTQRTRNKDSGHRVKLSLRRRLLPHAHLVAVAPGGGPQFEFGVEPGRASVPHQPEQFRADARVAVEVHQRVRCL